MFMIKCIGYILDIYSIVNIVEKKISVLESIALEIIQNETQKEDDNF
jgi:hypothetical protein